MKKQLQSSIVALCKWECYFIRPKKDICLKLDFIRQKFLSPEIKYVPLWPWNNHKIVGSYEFIK